MNYYKNNHHFSGFLMGLAFLLACPNISTASVFDFESSNTKLWLWPQSSQIYFLDPQTDSSLILYFYYNRDKTRLEAFEYETIGIPDPLSNPDTQKEDLVALLQSLSYGEDLSVFLEGPQQVDPLGPQPTEDQELYRKGLWSQGRHVEKEHTSGNRVLSWLKARLSGGRQPQHQAVLTSISFAQMRGIIKSDLTQDQIYFEIFRDMVLKMVKRTPPGEGFEKLNLQSVRCKSLL